MNILFYDNPRKGWVAFRCLSSNKASTIEASVKAKYTAINIRDVSSSNTSSGIDHNSTINEVRNTGTDGTVPSTGNYTTNLNDYMDGTYYWITVDTSTTYNQSYNGNYYHRVVFS